MKAKVALDTITEIKMVSLCTHYQHHVHLICRFSHSQFFVTCSKKSNKKLVGGGRGRGMGEESPGCCNLVLHIVVKSTVSPDNCTFPTAPEDNPILHITLVSRVILHNI